MGYGSTRPVLTDRELKTNERGRPKGPPPFYDLAPRSEQEANR